MKVNPGNARDRRNRPVRDDRVEWVSLAHQDSAFEEQGEFVLFHDRHDHALLCFALGGSGKSLLAAVDDVVGDQVAAAGAAGRAART